MLGDRDLHPSGPGASSHLAALLGCLLLAACAGGNLPKPVEEKPVEPSPEIAETVETVETDGYIELDIGIEADFDRAVTLMENGDYETAVVILESVVEREQRLIAPYVNLGIAYRKSGQYEQAETALSQALTIDVTHPVANNEIGLVFRQAGKFDQAKSAYEKAITADPAFAAAKRNLGVLCDLYMHDFTCALEQFQSYLELQPDDEEVPIWIADLKQRLGQ